MPRINLLPWREEQRKQRLKNFGIAAAAAVAVGIGVVLYAHVTVNRFIAYQNQRNKFLETQIATLDKQIAEIKELEATKERLLARMDLDVSQDSVGEQVPSATGGFVPSIDTRNVITQVLVNNGETVVLGGIHETNVSETYTKVPFLGDLPGVGKLFSSTQKTNNKTELLIFVTPRILKEGSNVY